MQIYILAGKNYAENNGLNEYDLVAELSEQEDIVFNKRFNDVGYCALKVAADTELLELLKVGNYIYRYDDDMFCKIVATTIDTDVEQGDYLTIDAEDMNNILAGRIVRWDVTYSGTVGGFIKKLITDNIINPLNTDGSLIKSRQIVNFEFDDKNIAEFNETINVAKDTATQDLLQLIITTCKTYNYGFRVSLNIETQKLVFRLIKGKNKATIDSDEYVEFSPNYANIISSQYKEDESNYKNVVYVGYKSANKDDENIYLLSLYEGQDAGAPEPQGAERREFYIDGSNTSREIQYDDLQSLYGIVTKDATNLTYNATIDNNQTVVAKYEISTTDGVSTEKITATDITYLKLIRIVGLNALAERTRTQLFNGKVDTVDTYIYKPAEGELGYNLGDIVFVANEYGIGAPAQITEVTESENADQPYEVEPAYEFIY